ncbi:hypothetical protein Tco_0329642, partial [Tanacetum coccineum]
FRDSYSPEDNEEEHIEVDIADAGVVVDVGISEGVVAHPEDGVGMGFEIAASDVREDDKEGGIPDLEDTIYDVVHYMSEVRIDRITKIETTQRQLETSQLVASGESYIRWHMALSQEEFRQVGRDRDDTRRR